MALLQRSILRRKKTTKVFTINPMSGIHCTMATANTPISELNIDNTAYLQHAKALCKQGRLKEALTILDIRDKHIDPSTYVFLLQGCIQKKYLADGRRIHAHIIADERGFMENRILRNTIVNMYVKCGSLEDARRVFDQIPERDVCSWTTMIAAYARHGPAEEALRLFQLMKRTGLRPNQFTFTSLLLACTQLGSVKEGVEIHEEIIRSGFEFDVPVANALIDMYGKCGLIEKARELFDKMPERDVVSWTAMIAGYARKGRADEALGIFRQMLRAGVEPNEVTFVGILPACAQLGFLEEGIEIHEEIKRRGFMSNVPVACALMDMHAKCGRLVKAREVFDEIPVRNVISWTVMIAGYARQGFAEEAWLLFRQMQETGIEPNHFTLASILPACAELESLELGVEVHEEIIGGGLESNVFVMTALIDMYAKCGSIDKARELFEKMPERNLVSWNTMIAGYAKNGLVEEALKHFQIMPQRDGFSWTAMIAGFAQNGLVGEAEKLFKEMPHRDVVSWNAMIAGFAQNGLVDEALKLFQEMPQRDEFSWTAMITGFAQNGLINKAMKLFEEMPQRTVVSWNAMIAACAQNGLVDEALKIFEEMPQRTVVSWNAMVAGFAQNGFVDKAMKLFREMPEQTSASWNAMISGFAQNGHGEEALKLFREMQLRGVKSGSKTFISILPACGSLASLELGMEIHEKVIRSGFQSDVVGANALIDMYAKCGSLQKAQRVFDTMHQRNIVSWTVMIAGYAMHGSGKEALDLFEHMKNSGMKPSHITLICVLSACSHAGLVDEGYHHFNSMSRNYHLTPRMEHYNCMVDLLGRAGHLDEAHEFINKMPIKPDATVWRTLLGACRIHNNIDLAELVAEHVVKLDTNTAAPYVLLSNMYATAGRWDDIETVRKIMKDRGVKKTAGCSWIEVNKQVHAFLVGDRLQITPTSSENLYKVGEIVLGTEARRVCSGGGGELGSDLEEESSFSMKGG